eukprot:scaffold388_cov244-Pinguiococcus_pyrenoidosus.AAC.23
MPPFGQRFLPLEAKRGVKGLADGHEQFHRVLHLLFRRRIDNAAIHELIKERAAVERRQRDVVVFDLQVDVGVVAHRHHLRTRMPRVVRILDESGLLCRQQGGDLGLGQRAEPSVGSAHGKQQPTDDAMRVLVHEVVHAGPAVNVDADEGVRLAEELGQIRLEHPVNHGGVDDHHGAVAEPRPEIASLHDAQEPCQVLAEEDVDESVQEPGHEPRSEEPVALGIVPGEWIRIVDGEAHVAAQGARDCSKRGRHDGHAKGDRDDDVSGDKYQHPPGFRDVKRPALTALDELLVRRSLCGRIGVLRLHQRVCDPGNVRQVQGHGRHKEALQVLQAVRSEPADVPR